MRSAAAGGERMRWKIRTKIIASTVLVVSISLVLSGFFTYEYASDVIRKQSVRDSMTKLAQISAQVNMVQKQIVKTAEYIVSDEEINRMIVPMSPPDLQRDYYRKLEVQERLKRFAALNAYVLNAMIIRADGEVYSNNPGYEDYFQDYLQQDWFTNFRARGARTGFTAPHNFFSLSRHQAVLSYVVEYRNLEQPREPNYFLVLDIAHSEITGAYEQSRGDFEQLVLFNGYDEPLFDSGFQGAEADGIEIAEAIAQQQDYSENDSYIVMSSSTMGDRWHQAAVLSKARLFAEINKIFQYDMLIILASIAFILIVFVPLILTFTRPISRLVQAMKRVSVGNLNTSVVIRSGDEMELLGQGFNKMVTELREHVQASIDHEKMKRTMQMSLLMSQINPHFVYNTLNTVIYLSHSEQSRQAAQITESLIAILQDTVKTGDGAFFATLQEEQGIVGRYIDIQHCRYPGQFTVHWEIPDELCQAVIPRMMIQPLVENALFHGICPYDRPGSIAIRARADGQQRLVVTVADDGGGMDEETAAGLFTRRDSGIHADQIRGIGLHNIRDRIQYHYGHGYGVEIKSSRGEGTAVSLVLPLDDGDEVQGSA